MSAISMEPTRRDVILATAAAGALSLVPGTLRAAASGSEAIRPFSVGFPQSELDELRRRVAATRWPEAETVTDDTQGVRLATIQSSSRASSCW